MHHAGVTGPRRLTQAETAQVAGELRATLTQHTALHVGDATGVDTMARAMAMTCAALHRYDVAGPEAWQLARRTKAMVKGVASNGGTLHAWVNKPCPPGLTRQSWKGSGTWGAVREAVALGVPVKLHHLGGPWPQPDWLLAAETTTQRALL
jgi:hypothetical protein